jgi:hypothetical protein
MIRVRSGYFTVNANVANATSRLRVNSWFDSSENNAVEVGVNQQTFRLTEYEWEDESGILTGTMWRVRERNLPSALRDGESEQVDSPLQESASFAYQPGTAKALIQYNHHGPRHSVFRAMLEEIGVGQPVTLTPCLIQDALQRMNDASLVRRVEYSLGDIQGVEPQLREIPGVGEAISAMHTLQGASIRVEISIGHNAGGLSDQAKKVVTDLAALARGVRTVKAGVKETEAESVQMLDVLGGREIIDMDINEAGRELDRVQLRSRLLVALRDHVTSSDDSNDDSHADDEA